MIFAQKNSKVVGCTNKKNILLPTRNVLIHSSIL